MIDNIKTTPNQLSGSLKNPYSNFSKVDLTSNKNYLYSVYSTNKVEYYNDPTKKKNKFLKKALLLSSAGLSILGAFAFAARSRGLNKVFNSVVEEVRKTAPEAKKITKEVSQDLGEKFGILSLNFTNLKDDLWDRFSCFLYDKTPFKFVKNLGSKITDVYLNNVKSSLKNPMERAQQEILELGGDSFKDKFKNYDEMFSSLSQKLKSRAQEERISSAANLLKGKDKVASLKDALLTPQVKTKTEDIVKNCANILEIPDGADEKLVEKIKQYNSLQKNSLIPKLCEISYGSAPTDIISMSIPVLGFGVALAKTEDKKERKSLLLNLGIPLLPTVMMPFLGTKFPVLNGVKSLVAGFAVGQVFSQGAKIIDKYVLKNEQEEETKK